MITMPTIKPKPLLFGAKAAHSNVTHYPRMPQTDCFVPSNKQLSGPSLKSVRFGQSCQPEYTQLFINAPGFSKNEAWAQAMWQGVESLSQDINNHKLPRVRDALNILSNLYQTHVQGKGWWNYEDRNPYFSRSAGPGTSEQSQVRRAIYADRIRKLAEQGVPSQFGKTFFIRRDGLTLSGNTIYTHPNGSETLAWIYTDGPTSKKVVDNQLNQLYQKALEFKHHIQPTNLEQAIETVASIHWWLIHAMPFDGGTAGISDMLTKALFKHLGIQTSAWKENIIPDMEALVTPSLEEYVKNYPSFFKKPLKLISSH